MVNPNNPTIRWRCTSQKFDSRNRRSRCNVSLVTKVVNGYEMIRRISNVKHEHKKVL